MRLTEEAVAAVTNGPARQFLAEQGLPDTEVLVDVYASDAVHVEEAAGRRFLMVARSTETEQMGIDLDTAEVVAVNSVNGAVQHVNRDVRTFAAALAHFDEGYPFYPFAADSEVLEAAAASLRDELLRIDSTCLDEDPGYWNGILFDVALGLSVHRGAHRRLATSGGCGRRDCEGMCRLQLVHQRRRLRPYLSSLSVGDDRARSCRRNLLCSQAVSLYSKALKPSMVS